MIFAEPGWLWALLALPLLAAAEAWTTRRDRARTARLVARPLWGKVVRTPAESWRFVRLALVLLGAAGLVVALARPQWGIVREKVEREGVDVVVLLDTSGSMATEDVPPNRFQVARTAVMNLVRRLDGNRFALVAFEGEAYPLVPLTLDIDAIGLFLETLEPGAVPKAGTSLGAGLDKGLAAFADKGRQNKVMVLVSDGEDLEGEVEGAVRAAREAGVIVHTVGVGTAAGQPVPDFDREGNRTGYKKDEDGSVHVSRLHADILETIARGAGGRTFALTPADLSLSSLASAIEGMEQKALAREYSYRKKERFQVPLAIGLGGLALALLLPPPERRRRGAAAGRAAAALIGLALVAPSATAAEPPRIADELLLRPTRLTEEGRKQYKQGNAPKALEAFTKASAARPADPRAQFNLADAYYKSGNYDEARTRYEALGADPRSPLAASARYNLGNTLFQKQDYPGAVRAYRDALRLAPGDKDTRHNLEMALRALQQQQQPKPDKNQQEPQGKDDKKEQPQGDKDKAQDQQKPGGQRPQPPKTQEEKERERFQKETGMPKERAMQLLDALEQNEKAQQRKLQAARRKPAPKGKDW
jgi:Ca-activated chloride channel family protein